MPDDPIELGEAFDILLPAQQTVPLVFASPHSGCDYPSAFLSGSPLDALSLRRSEDSFVDRIFGAAPQHGAPLIRALFPRAFIDPNREAYELDPAMFEDDLPAFANTRSPRVAAGLGVIAKVVGAGAPIYREKLRYAEAARRIERCYKPYHAALNRLVEASRRKFGGALLIDCHSMPSTGGPQDRDAGRARVDIVLGDCHGASCRPEITAAAKALLVKLGFNVACNAPYAGGYTTRHYGRPAERRHALQIEINRSLYMDEQCITPTAGFPLLRQAMNAFVGEFAERSAALVGAPR